MFTSCLIGPRRTPTMAKTDNTFASAEYDMPSNESVFRSCLTTLGPLTFIVSRGRVRNPHGEIEDEKPSRPVK
jgi:hypothetical protein